MADSEQNLDSNTLPPAPMADKAMWVNMFSQLQNTLTETTNLLSELRADRASQMRVSEDSTTPALEEANMKRFYCQKDH